MNWFTRNSPYYHLLNYLLFLLKHPVYYCNTFKTLVLMSLHYWFVDKSLAWPGRKQARKDISDARDFNNIETQTIIKFFFQQSMGPKEIHAILTETLACFLSGRTYQHPCNKAQKTVFNQYLFRFDRYTILPSDKKANLGAQSRCGQSFPWRPL